VRQQKAKLYGSLQRLLDLRGEASLRIRATAKPIITSTPAITSARFTGRHYLRVRRTAARNCTTGTSCAQDSGA